MCVSVAISLCHVRTHLPLPRLLSRCGTASSNAQPRPDIDPRSSLDINNRLQTPYDWLMSDTCRQQARAPWAAYPVRTVVLSVALH
jgi:hypothetical protein